MPESAIALPPGTGLGIPGQGRPNTQSAATTMPAVSPVAGGLLSGPTSAANKPVDGAIDKKIQPDSTEQMVEKLAALRRAEALSIFYKYGAAPCRINGQLALRFNKRAVDADAEKSTALGTLAGAGTGAALGAGSAARELAYKPLEAPLDIKLPKGGDLAAKLSAGLEARKQQAAQTVALNAGKPQGSLRRLLAVARQAPASSVLHVLMRAGLLGGIGAGAGAGVGWAASKLTPAKPPAKGKSRK